MTCIYLTRQAWASAFRAALCGAFSGHGIAP